MDEKVNLFFYLSSQLSEEVPIAASENIHPIKLQKERPFGRSFLMPRYNIVPVRARARGIYWIHRPPAPRVSPAG